MNLFSDYAIDFCAGAPGTYGGAVAPVLAWHVVRRRDGSIFDGPYDNERTAQDRLYYLRVMEAYLRGDLVLGTPILLHESTINP